MKKKYLAPDVDYIKFYSSEDMTAGDGQSILEGGNEEGAPSPDWD